MVSPSNPLIQQADFLFLDLISISLHQGRTLERIPSVYEWQKLFRCTQEQAVAGVCFVGIQRLKKHGICPPNDVYMQWLSHAAMIQQRNRRMNQWTARLCQQILEDGFETCVLKGQSLAMLYGLKENKDCAGKSNDLALLRQPGDIDVWLLASHKDVIRWGQSKGGIWYYDYHHADLLGFHDAEVELHYRPTLSRNLWRNVKLQRWFRKEGTKLVNRNGKVGFPIPCDNFNLILVLNHNFWHLLYEGVGMRQMMDLYFVLNNYADNSDDIKRAELVKRFGLRKFTAASMWVMKEVFGLPEEKMICKPNEQSGSFLLNEIMMAGNFGHSDKRLRNIKHGNRVKLMWSWIKHNFRLFRYYPADVLWTPFGVLYISLWRRWHYAIDGFKLDKR